MVCVSKFIGIGWAPNLALLPRGKKTIRGRESDCLNIKACEFGHVFLKMELNSICQSFLLMEFDTFNASCLHHFHLANPLEGFPSIVGRLLFSGRSTAFNFETKCRSDQFFANLCMGVGKFFGSGWVKIPTRVGAGPRSAWVDRLVKRSLTVVPPQFGPYFF